MYKKILELYKNKNYFQFYSSAYSLTLTKHHDSLFINGLLTNISFNQFYDMILQMICDDEKDSYCEFCHDYNKELKFVEFIDGSRYIGFGQEKIYFREDGTFDNVTSFFDHNITENEVIELIRKDLF